MSNDKFENLTPVSIDFTEGERPTEVKLDGAFQQVKDGLTELEYLVGDPYGFSGNKPLNFINNFSRDIGDRDKLSPKYEPDVLIDDYEQSLTVDLTEHELDLIPVGTGASILNSSSDASVVVGQFKASLDLMDTTGDWTIASGLLEDGVQKNSRKLITFAPSDGGTIEFAQVTTGHGDAYTGARWNLLPTKPQADASGDLITVVVLDSLNNIYELTLPTNDTNYNRLGESGSATLSNTDIVGTGRQLTLPSYFFDPSGLDLETNDGFTGFGKVYPLGLVRVFDWDAMIVIEGLLEVKAADLAGDRRFKVIVTFESGVVLDDISGRYSLLTSGTSISELLDKVRTEFYNHKHDGDDLVRHLDHKSLMGLRTSADLGNISDWYGTSNIDNNDHSMYLHRGGLDQGDAGGGYNLMRGTILIGSQDSAGPVPNFNLDDDSHSLMFGDDLGPEIYFDFEATQNLLFDPGFGDVPLTFTDEPILRIIGADNGSKSTTLFEGDLRVTKDVVLGSTDTDVAIIQGLGYVTTALHFRDKASFTSPPSAGRVEWVNRPSAWDGTRWRGLLYSEFAAVVGISDGATHTTLEAVLADASVLSGDRILLLDSITLTAPIAWNKSLWVEGYGTGKQIIGTSLIASAVGLTVTVSQTMWKNIDFTGFGSSKTALYFNTGSDKFRVHECLFNTTNSTDINIAAGITAFSIANNITY